MPSGVRNAGYINRGNAISRIFSYSQRESKNQSWGCAETRKRLMSEVRA